MNIPQSQSFTTWAGWLIPYDRDFYLIVDEAHSPTALGEAVRDLALIGLDRMAGYFDVQAVDDWTQDGVRELESIPELTAQDVAAKVASGEATLVDVRGLSEWEAAHVPGVTHIPLGYLGDRIDELDSSRPVILQCQGGARSAIGASVLQAKGFKNVMNQRGGFGHWQAIGLEVEHGAGATV